MVEDLKLLLGQAVRSEIEAREFYSEMARGVKNLLLKERLEFLAREEEKHEEFLRGLFAGRFPGQGIPVPETTPVPGPVYVPGDKTPVSDLLAEAAEAEVRARDFYMDLASRFESPLSELLEYLSMMEQGHFYILEAEREMALRFEDYEDINPMFHIGA